MQFAMCPFCGGGGGVEGDEDGYGSHKQRGSRHRQPQQRQPAQRGGPRTGGAPVREGAKARGGRCKSEQAAAVTAGRVRHDLPGGRWRSRMRAAMVGVDSAGRPTAARSLGALRHKAGCIGGGASAGDWHRGTHPHRHDTVGVDEMHAHGVRAPKGAFVCAGRRKASLPGRASPRRVNMNRPL